jgi:hypothetical protein
MRFLLGLFLSMAFSHAMAVTIDFEGVVADDEYTGISLFPNGIYQEDGFSIEMSSGEGGVAGRNFIGFDSGSAYLEWCASDDYCPGGVIVTLSSSDDSPFSLSSLDVISELGASTYTFQVTGYLLGGGSISQTIEANQAAWTTMSFDSDWANLDYVTFDGLGPEDWAPGVDNIVVSAVPVPAAVWLFGSALAGLGWFRRRQTA